MAWAGSCWLRHVLVVWLVLCGYPSEGFWRLLAIQMASIQSRLEFALTIVLNIGHSYSISNIGFC